MKLQEKFWYDSNACWGWVESLEDLQEKVKLQIKENNGIDTIDDFLNKSKQHLTGELCFGTQQENTGKSLREFLTETGFDINLLREKK